MMRAAEIHARLRDSWPTVLARLGIPETALHNEHGPCPACGGKDRFRFDNKHGHGDFICAQCGPGDGFALLERVHGWRFSEARKRVIETAGLSEDLTPLLTPHTPRAPPAEVVAMPTQRVQWLRRELCAIADCVDAVDFLASRGLWPLPEGCTLSAHASVQYFEHGGRPVGRYPTIVADVVDVAGELVTVHVTYLQHGRKLAGHEPRKILSKMDGRVGCAVRLMPATDVLGIAEGIETALSATFLHGVPVWAALTNTLLGKFEPPPGVSQVMIYADRDEPGLTAARRLTERLQGRVSVETRIPSALKDWNDVLMTQRAAVAAKAATS